MRDLIEVLAIVACLLVPFAVCQLWIWFWFAFMMIVIFGLWEAYAALIHKDKMTLTEHFRKFKKRKPMEAWICAISIAVGWCVLLVHLLRG